MKAAQKRFAQAINALKLEVDESIALSIFELHIQAKEEYAREVAEDLRERIAENATAYNSAPRVYSDAVVDTRSILNVEIITP